MRLIILMSPGWLQHGDFNTGHREDKYLVGDQARRSGAFETSAHELCSTGHSPPYYVSTVNQS